MIQNDVVTQLQLLIKTSAPPLLEVSQQQLELPQLVPGQKVPAFVVANLPNGRFQVLIADKMLDMNLPKNTQPGDTVDLVFVTTKPRLTFVLASDLGNAANSANAANAKSQVSLSDTARFLGGLLEKAAQPDSTNSATKGMASAVTQATPLLSGAPANTLGFAQALRGALTQSGLFYESHQAQWVTGQRPLTDLLREPQGRLSPATANQPQAATVNVQATGTTTTAIIEPAAFERPANFRSNCPPRYPAARAPAAGSPGFPPGCVARPGLAGTNDGLENRGTVGTGAER